MNDPLTLVLGGTGKSGRRVAERLWSRGKPVRLGSRSASPPFDWQRPATWPAALDGVRSVYQSYYPDVAAPGAPEAVRAFTSDARAAGVRRVVFLSGRNEPGALRAEAAVAESGLEWTIVRASFFAQNFSEGAFFPPLLDGHLMLPVGDVGEPFVDADDVAAVVVEALLGDEHVEQIYELTGPRLWTFADAVAEIAAASGRDLRYSQVSADDYSRALETAGLGEEERGLIVYLLTELLDGRGASVHDDVRRVLGRPARDFSAFVRDAAEQGVWSPRDGSRSTASAAHALSR
jgi:uncharacterized protein YbjT (DUF2867 family)